MSSDYVLKLKIITPEGILHELENLTAVNVPLVNGYVIGIRPGHAPLIAETRQGKVICRTLTSEIPLELHGGVCEVRNNEVSVFTAGEVPNLASEQSKPSESTYDRLMQTLIKKVELS